MATFINQLLAANASRAVPLPSPTRAMFVGQQGMNSGLGMLQDVGKQIKQNRINSDIGTALASMGDTDGMSPTQYQDALFRSIGQIDGVSALDALGIASKLSKPRFDARDYRDSRTDAENLNSYRSTLAGRGSFGLDTDDYGNVWKFDKYTGDVDLIRKGNNSGINPKNVVLKPVTSRDANGIESTQYVPFDKTTGKPVEQPVNTDVLSTVPEQDLVNFLKQEYNITSAEQFNALPVDKQNEIRQNAVSAFTPVTSDGTPLGVGIKYPKVDNKDKQYLDNMGVLTKQIDDLEKMIDSDEYATAFGPVDQYTGKVGSLWASDDSTKQAKAEAVISNLLAGFGKAQMAGVLTDQDMEIIRKQIPDIGDQPRIAKEKLNFIKDYIDFRNKAFLSRMDKSNPNYVDMNHDLNKQIEKTRKEGSKYGSDADIISF